MIHHNTHHRHFIAAPLVALLLLVVGTLDRSLPVRASSESGLIERMLSATDTPNQFSTPAGVTGLLAPHSRVALLEGGQMFRLEKGSLILRGAGIALVDIGFGVRAGVMDGSMLTLHDDVSASVVALKEPVALSEKDAIHILPVGYQYRIDRTGIAKQTRVPDSWLEGQIAGISALPQTDVPPISASRSNGEMLQSLLDTLITSDAPLSPAMQSQLRDVDPLSRLSLLMTMLNVSSDQPIDRVRLSGVLSVAESASDPLVPLLALLHLSFQSDQLDPMASALLARRFIASFSDERTECITAIPRIASTSLKPLPKELLDAWVQITLRSASKDASRTVSLLQGLLGSLPERYEAAGFPKQALLWRQSMVQIANPIALLLTGPERETFLGEIASAVRNQFTIDDSAVSVSSSAPSVAVKTYSSDELRILTREVLELHHVLFTATTQIIPDASSECAAVTSVFLSEYEQDTPYTFSFCPGDWTIRSIVRSGIPLPNSLPVDQFLHT